MVQGYSLQEEDIPLLTEVHALAPTLPKSSMVNSELLAEILVQLKPQLSAWMQDEAERVITQKLDEKIPAYVANALTQQTANELANVHAAQEKTVITGVVQPTVLSSQPIQTQNVQESSGIGIPKMEHGNVEVIKSDLMQALNEMRIQGRVNEQSSFGQSLPAIERTIHQQLEISLQHLEQEMTTRAMQKLQANATVVLDNLMRPIVKMPQQKTDSSEALIGALPQHQDALTDKLRGALQNIEVDTVEKATQLLQERIIHLHSELFTEHQARLTLEYEAVYQGLSSQIQAELQTQLEALQSNAKQPLSAETHQTLPSLYENISNDIRDKVKQELAQSIKSEVENMLASVRLTFKP